MITCLLLTTSPNQDIYFISNFWGSQLCHYLFYENIDLQKAVDSLPQLSLHPFDRINYDPLVSFQIRHLF